VRTSPGGYLKLKRDPSWIGMPTLHKWKRTPCLPEAMSRELWKDNRDEEKLCRVFIDFETCHLYSGHLLFPILFSLVGVGLPIVFPSSKQGVSDQPGPSDSADSQAGFKQFPPPAATSACNFWTIRDLNWAFFNDVSLPA
jgi:hypothetical protein